MTDPLFATPWSPQSRSFSEYDRPFGWKHQSRSMTVSTNGIVATSHPLAADVGLDVLKQGGNAVDAAIAANAMLGLVEPMSCGIGGDLFCLHFDSATQSLHGLNASGRSPAAANIELFRERGLSNIPIDGPLSWSVPGCVDGWHMLLDRFGTKTMRDVLQPAIDYGHGGFPVTEVIAGYWRGAARKLRAWPDSTATFLPGDEAPREGGVFQNSALAASYELIAASGRDAFYCGSIADRIVRFSDANDGLFHQDDFKTHTSDWVDPVSCNYRGYDVWELPPNGQGIAALQMLNVLEGYDVASWGRNYPDALHVFVEAKKLAFADRAKYYADPDFNDIPVAELISEDYAERQRSRIDMNRAAVDVPAGDPKLQHGDTVYITVVDRDRNCCSLIQSNYFGFGSMVTPGDVGFVLQNRGSLFALDESHFNCVEPRKRPFHTIIPAMVTKDGSPFLCFGVMGGDMQPQGHVQVLMNIFDYGMNVQQAGDAARIRHSGSQQPTGTPMKDGGGMVTVESGIPDAAVQSLIDRGHNVGRSPGGFGGYQAILIDHDRGTLHGATEPRKDGAAVGY